jgi:hypothetical protein
MNVCNHEHYYYLRICSDGGMNSSSCSSNIIALSSNVHRDISTSNLTVPRVSSSTSINTMRKDLSSGSFGSIEASADAQLQQQLTGEAPRTRMQSGNHMTNVAKVSPSGAAGSSRKSLTNFGSGVGIGSGDHDAYDACVFALGGEASKLQGHMASNIHK